MTNTSDYIFMFLFGTSIVLYFSYKPSKKTHKTVNTNNIHTQTYTNPKRHASTTTDGLADYIIVEYCPRL